MVEIKKLIDCLKHGVPSLSSECPYCKIESLQAELERYRWIPVSERLPYEEGRYLIKYKKYNQVRVFIADFLPIEERWTNTLDAEILFWRDENLAAIQGGTNESG